MVKKEKKPKKKQNKHIKRSQLAQIAVVHVGRGLRTDKEITALSYCVLETAESLNFCLVTFHKEYLTSQVCAKTSSKK
jgi:hypothetical protein